MTGLFMSWNSPPILYLITPGLFSSGSLSQASTCWDSTSSARSVNVSPPRVDTVPVKQRSTTSSDSPIASNSCAER